MCVYSASVATIARVPYAYQLLSNPDYLYNFTDLAIWSIVECGIAITASSLATLRPLFIEMKFLASAHFTSRYGYGHSRATSSGLPMQSVNSVTVISSHGRSMKSKRSTAMTGSTAVSMSHYNSRGTSQSGILSSVKEGNLEKGIQVDTEFEMSIVTKETSFDSLDRFEAEVNEVITPGTTRRKPSYDQMHTPRKSSFGSRPPPPPIDPQYQASPISAEPAATMTSSPSAGPPYSSSRASSPQTRRRPSEGPPPSFHLPTRLHHQSTISDKSTHSVLTRFDSRATLQGLSAPPRVPQTGHSPSPDDQPLGPPISMRMSGRSSRRPSGSAITTTTTPPQLPSPASSGSRYPFPTQNPIPEPKRRGKPRVSAFLSEAGDPSESSSWSPERFDKDPESPVWTRLSPQLASVPNPLRSNPSGSPGPQGSWV